MILPGTFGPLGRTPIRSLPVRFDGSTGLHRDSAYPGGSDSHHWVASFWIRPHENAREEFLLYARSPDNINRRVMIWRETENRIAVIASDAGGAGPRFTCRSNVNSIMAGQWSHVLWAQNFNGGGFPTASRTHLYVTDQRQVNYSYIDDAAAGLDFTLGLWHVGQDPDGARRLNADVMDFWFRPGGAGFLDMSVDENRRKFITADLQPVDLGADGTATGMPAPWIWMSRRAHEVPSGFGVNKDSSFLFNTTGALLQSTTAPYRGYHQEA